MLLEFEQSSYEVLEDVGLEDLAVRVCLIIRRIPYDISVTLVTAPGTAQGRVCVDNSQVGGWGFGGGAEDVGHASLDVP